MKKLLLAIVLMFLGLSSFAQFSTEVLVNDDRIDEWDGKKDGNFKYAKAAEAQKGFFVINEDNEVEHIESVALDGKSSDKVYAEIKDWLTSKVESKNIQCLDDQKKIKIDYYSESVGVILKLTTDTKNHVHFRVVIEVKEQAVRISYLDLEYLQTKTAIMAGGFESDLANAKHLSAKNYIPLGKESAAPMSKGYCLACVHAVKTTDKIKKIISEL